MEHLAPFSTSRGTSAALLPLALILLS